jgi:glycine reductase
MQDDGVKSLKTGRISGMGLDLSGKKVLALGERDGVQGAAIAQCASSAGAEVVLEMTHCFV